MHLHLVAVAWAYVVLMMTLAEAVSPQGTIVGVLITLALYGVLPLGLVLYILGTPQRRRARRAAEAAESPERADAPPTEPPSAPPLAAVVGPPTPGRPGTTSSPRPAGPSATPDGRGHAPGDAVASVRKEP